jgi:hypothetical protein
MKAGCQAFLLFCYLVGPGEELFLFSKSSFKLPAKVDAFGLVNHYLVLSHSHESRYCRGFFFLWILSN